MPSEIAQQKNNPFIQSANGEVFNRYLGIGIFDPTIKRDFENLNYLWLPGETREVFCRLVGTKKQSVILEGGAGSGKSAILYGMRALSRQSGLGYYYIDGHYEKTSVEPLIETLETAQANGSLVFFDSADYLIGKSKKIRGLPVEDHRTRSIKIIDALIGYHASGGLLVLTSHTEDWIRHLGDEDLIPHWEELRKRLYVHPVRGEFSGAEELQNFYEKSGLVHIEASYLSRLLNNQDFVAHLIEKKADGKYLDWLTSIFYLYRIAKVLVADKFKHNELLLNQLKVFLETGEGEQNVWDAFIDFAFEKDYRLLFHSKL